MDLQPPKQEKQQDALEIGLITETGKYYGWTHTSTVCYFDEAIFKKLDTYSYNCNEQVFPQEVLLVQRGEEGGL